MNEIQLLKQEVAELRKEVKSLTDASSISLQVEKSFMERGFLNTGKPGYPDVGFAYTTNTGFRTDVVLTGEGQTITVPSFPIRFLKLKDENLYIPLHTYAEFGL